MWDSGTCATHSVCVEAKSTAEEHRDRAVLVCLALRDEHLALGVMLRPQLVALGLLPVATAGLQGACGQHLQANVVRRWLIWQFPPFLL